MNPRHKLVFQKQFILIAVFGTALLSFYVLFELVKTFFTTYPFVVNTFEKCMKSLGSTLNKSSILTLSILTASVLGLIFFVYQFIKTKYFIRSFSFIPVLKTRVSFQKLVEDLHLAKKIKVVDSIELLCFCAGILHPAIYISRATLQKLTINELKAVLIHEKHHLEHNAPFKMIVLRLISEVFFYIPALKELSHHYMILDEIQADNQVMTYPLGKLHLAQAFYKFADTPKGAQYLTTTFIENTYGAIEIRINRLSDTSLQPRLKISIPSLVVHIGLFIAIMVFLHTQTSLYAKEQPQSNCKNTQATYSSNRKADMLDTLWPVSLPIDK